MTITGSKIGIGVTSPDSTLHIAGNVHISGSDQEGLRIAKGDSDYRQIVFETDGTDSANIHLSNAENLVIMNETAGKDIQFWVDSAAGSVAVRWELVVVVGVGLLVAVAAAGSLVAAGSGGFGCCWRTDSG